MKRKIICLFTAITLLSSVAFGFTACGEQDVHTHEFNRMVKEERYVKTAATCTSYAVYYYSCECGEKGAGTFVGDEYGSHSLAHIEKQPETCTESGKKEYWTCNGGCGLSFADEKGEQIINLDSSEMVIPAAHKLTYHKKVTATCTTNGVKEYWSCSACKSNFADADASQPIDDLVIPAAHVGWENNVCTGCGYNAGGTAGLEYSLYYDTLSYSVSNGEVNSGEVVIPSTYNGLLVSAVGSFKNSLITGISIPDTVENISHDAFEGCNNLSDVKLSAGLKSISSGLFRECTSLKKITIPEGVASIQGSAFSGCSALTEITLPDSLKSIDTFAFANCFALKNIILPDGLEKIDGIAFADCRSLTEIIIPESVIEIGQKAFYMCYGITVYCEAAEKPDGWNEDWHCLEDEEYCEVVWGRKQKNL